MVQANRNAVRRTHMGFMYTVVATLLESVWEERGARAAATAGAVGGCGDETAEVATARGGGE